jgi:hypothetical protein
MNELSDDDVHHLIYSIKSNSESILDILSPVKNSKILSRTRRHKKLKQKNKRTAKV